MSAGHRTKPWYERYPDRFAEEAAILNREGFALDQNALDREHRVQFLGYTKHDKRRVIVQFPEGFPSFPPQICDTKDSPALHRHHNPNTRQFCLFGPGSQRWSARCSVQDALVEMEQLLQLFSVKGSVDADDVPEPITSVLNYTEAAAVLVPESIVDAVTESAPFSVRNIFKMAYQFDDPVHPNKNICGRGVIAEARWNGKMLQPGGSEKILPKSRIVEGFLHVLNACPDYSVLPQIVKQCFEAIAIKGKPKDTWLALVFPQQTCNRKTQQLTWVVLKIWHEGKYALLRTYPLRASDRTSRIPGFQLLALKKVSLVGCGCLGSKIGANLAASGVERFALFDSDFFDPNNSVRHECGWDAFGIPKAVALAHRLMLLNPRCRDGITGHVIRVGAAEPQHNSKALEEIFASDLVIDTTGSHSTSRFLNEICYTNNVPVLFASVTEGAWGGEILRVVPEQNPCWLCWLTQYYDRHPPSAPRPEVGIFHPGCDQPSFTGTSFETGIVANAAAWNAVEILLRNTPGRRDFQVPYHTWHARDEQGNPVLRWEQLSVVARPDCSICRRERSTGA